MSPEERASAIIADLDDAGRNYDSHQYGLPVYDDATSATMLALVQEHIKAAVAEAEQRCDNIMAILHGRQPGEDWTSWAKRRQEEWNQRVKDAVAERTEECAKIAANYPSSGRDAPGAAIASLIRRLP